MRAILTAIVLLGNLVPPDVAFAANETTIEPIRVVYHFDDAGSASKGLRNIRNHLNADPATQVVVVANGGGVDFMLVDQLDPSGEPYELVILDLQQRGVKFVACNNTLLGRGIARDRLVQDVSIVQAGVEEVARLQFRLGYAYIKP
jgi:intracellular sulfur oxidation DsrE/DsrF family protein